MLTEAIIKKNLMHNYTEKQRNEAYELVKLVKDYISKDYYDEFRGETTEEKEYDAANYIDEIIFIADKYNLSKGLLLTLLNFTNDYDGVGKSWEILENDDLEVDQKINDYLFNIEDHSQLPTSIFMEFVLRYNSNYDLYKEKIIERLKEIYPYDENDRVKDKYINGWYFGSYYKTEFVEG